MFSVTLKILSVSNKILFGINLMYLRHFIMFSKEDATNLGHVNNTNFMLQGHAKIVVP